VVTAETALQAALAAKNNVNPKTRFTLPIFDDQATLIGRLVCLDEGLSNSHEVISNLTQWRQKYMRYFLTQFEATFERTQHWVKNGVIPDPSRILFLIETADGDILGNFGVCNIETHSAELDNLIRGKKGGHQKLIYFAEIAMLFWIFNVLEKKEAALHVFSNNDRTIALHTSIGFSANTSFELFKNKTKEGLAYSVEKNNGALVDFQYLKMNLPAELFFQMHTWVKSAYF
jgi:RimJ/RimL family protein N-acetyltransferase